jgi:hypothetical protein
MNTEQLANTAVLIQCFNELADIYGFPRHQKARRTKNNARALYNGVKWLNQLPHLTAREFVEAQVRAIDESRVGTISFSSLFQNKQVCLERLGVDAQISATAYEDYLIYYDTVVKGIERVVTKQIPGQWYACRDDVLLDPNQGWPKWFILMEITDLSRISERLLVRYKKSIKREATSEPALKKLLKEKYGRTSECNKYQQRLAEWL